ncbi:MAG: thioredoxin domain-containing protein [Tannerellaceae bacterium]
MTIINLTSESFITLVGDYETNPTDWKYVGNLPCIVDFTAPWCSYCKRLNPILDEFAEAYDGRIIIYKVDVDQEEALETAFNIRTIPTLLFCPLVGTRESLIATMPKNELKALIEEKLLR